MVAPGLHFVMPRRLLTFCALAAALAWALPLDGAAIARHTRLVRSEPPADSTLARSPASIQLWFNEVVPLAATRVRLTDARGAVVVLSPLRRDSATVTAPVAAAVASPLPDGAYRLEWVTASKDGHAVSGHFAFHVRHTP